MKRPLLLLIATISLLSACRRNIACRNTGNYQLQFFTPSLADTIYDTSAMIVKYAKGSNFISLVDTIHHIHLQTINIYSEDRYAQRAIDYTGYSSDIYATDLLVVLYPSGNIYKLTGIAHNNKTMTEKNSDHYACTDDITYFSNGTSYQCAGQIFTTGAGNVTMYIRY